MSEIVLKLRSIARDKASRSNFARASYCAGRAGCDDLRKVHNEPKDFIEWQAADEIERLERAAAR